LSSRSDVQLNGRQKNQLYKALLSAFPDRPSLARMVNYQLDVNLAAIAGDGPLNGVIAELITWAEAQGRIQELIESAQLENPGNPALQECARQFGIVPHTPDVPALDAGPRDQLHRVLEVAEQLNERAQEILETNETAILPFLHDPTTRPQLRERMIDIFNQQFNRWRFGEWRGVLEILAEQATDPRLQTLISSLLQSLFLLRDTCYAYKGGSADPDIPSPFQTRGMLVQTLTATAPSASDADVLEVANLFLNSLRDQMETIGSLTGRLRALAGQ
jgi:hypothetical protein